MNEQEKRELMIDFERNRQMLGSVSAQKQQYHMQVEVIKVSLEELNNTKEKTVLKVIGNILVNKPVGEMKKELSEQQESFELRLKTLERQEETIVSKLNSIRNKIEGKTGNEEEKPKKSKK